MKGSLLLIDIEESNKQKQRYFADPSGSKLQISLNDQILSKPMDFSEEGPNLACGIETRTLKQSASKRTSRFTPYSNKRGKKNLTKGW